MMKLDALVLLLAVCASQFNLHEAVVFIGSGEFDHHTCPMVVCGTVSSRMRVSFNKSLFSISSEISPHCLSLVDPQDDRVSAEVLFEDTNPGSVINQAIPSFNTTSHCKIKLELQDEALRTHVVIVLYNYGEKSAIQVIATSDFSSSTLVLLHEVNNIPVHSRSLDLADTDRQNGVIFRVSTCQFARWTQCSLANVTSS
ncbi:uncharacterized protein [Nothobranchius furzeri]|uniref:Transcript variant X2 n=1 Tax=Nothobranchius furzeri TaxID=105023 RepID=A0A9D2XRX1_NOTFU|nr:transcript variant X2 [Nothobranchius furzeri]